MAMVLLACIATGIAIALKGQLSLPFSQEMKKRMVLNRYYKSLTSILSIQCKQIVIKVVFLCEI